MRHVKGCLWLRVCLWEDVSALTRMDSPLAQGLRAVVLCCHVLRSLNQWAAVNFLSIRWQPHVFAKGWKAYRYICIPLSFTDPKFQTSQKHLCHPQHQSALPYSVLTIPEVWVDLGRPCSPSCVVVQGSWFFCSISWLLVLFGLRSGPLGCAWLPVHISSL